MAENRWELDEEIMKTVQEFYHKTGIRIKTIQIDWWIAKNMNEERESKSIVTNIKYQI